MLSFLPCLCRYRIVHDPTGEFAAAMLDAASGTIEASMLKVRSPCACRLGRRGCFWRLRI